MPQFGHMKPQAMGNHTCLISQLYNMTLTNMHVACGYSVSV